MRGFNIFLPNGYTHTIKYNIGDDKVAIADAIVTEWSEYCDNNWLSPDYENRYCGENKVKRFMDSVTNFLLYTETDDVITDYKDKRNKEHEVLIPGVHDGLVPGVPVEVVEATETAPSAFTAKGKYKSKEVPTETVFNRIEKVKRENQSLEMSVCAVDTDGGFGYKGTAYCVSGDIPQYQGRETKSGTHYNMDRVLCGVEDDGQMIFLDQFGVRLDNNKVKVVNGKVDNDETRNTY